MIYDIEITETLQRTIQVNAESVEDAIRQVRKDYFNCDINLDEDDIVATEFNSLTETAK